MAHITTCTHCGSAYEASSEESANERDRQCGRCYADRCLNRCHNGTATPFEYALARREFINVPPEALSVSAAQRSAR